MPIIFARQHRVTGLRYLELRSSQELEMKSWILLLGIAASQVVSATASAQHATAEERAAARTERRAQGAAAARSFKPGEGDPKPEARRRVPRAERTAARAERRPVGAQAAREFKPGEGNPVPEARVGLPREERVAARKDQRAEVRRANKAGEIPSFGESYGGR
jgi:hypothetical protein